MYLTGFADEAASDIDSQIKATKELGWKFIEARAIDGINLTSVSEEKFSEVCDKLQDAKISINCFGSGVANWSQKMTEPPDPSYAEMERAIPRMKRLGTKLIRIMSFAIPPEALDQDWSVEAIKRIKVIAKLAEDNGIVCVHENCSGWGSLSYEHTLRLLEGVNSPALKLVFDTGNPVFDDDVRGVKPYKKQNSLEFYRAVREHIIYVHIKDGYIDGDKPVFTFPGEGNGYVREILTDLLKTGYDGGFSVEPHMTVVFHDQSVKSETKIRYRNYVEYGRRLERMLAEIKTQSS
ncbi:MAG: sugar phosphate isomerase/epimerase family protein [Candidatus Omnitrophota bacterium]|nr:sugar phosphate isomerase/epimerase [Candidatus Omnitrophota bacterium]